MMRIRNERIYAFRTWCDTFSKLLTRLSLEKTTKSSRLNVTYVCNYDVFNINITTRLFF